MRLEVTKRTSITIPGYEPDIKLYVNQGGEESSPRRRIHIGLFCQEAITLLIEPTHGSKLIAPCHVKAVANPKTPMKDHAIQRFFLLGGILLYT
jgi:hypothetical protein